MGLETVGWMHMLDLLAFLKAVINRGIPVKIREFCDQLADC
jgi:hypothetical protein